MDAAVTPGTGPTLGSSRARQHPLAAYAQADLSKLGFYMLMLMMRNVTSAGFRFEDPASPGSYSLQGCIVAAPSFPANTPGIDQDYLFNWVRDGAITAIEMAEAGLPVVNGGVDALGDYVDFARLCYDNAAPTKGHACFTVTGQSRPWTEQSDGPALQTLALLRAHAQLTAASQAKAIDLIGRNLDYLIANHQQPTTNLWEEHQGQSFFARSVQLRCFREIAANTLGIAVPAGVAPAIAWLDAALASHWNGSLYLSLLDPNQANPVSVALGYDANIDIVSAAVYGAVPYTDTKLLATAAVLRDQWSNPGSRFYYAINGADEALGLGPLIGRYPGDVYDGDVNHSVMGAHPWALCTANFAELYYGLASEIVASGALPYDALSAPLFTQVGVAAGASPAVAAAALRDAGDRMLRAILYHSDNYELSEQFDGTSGYEKSVRNLTWSYAAMLSALRARAR